jgi:magnesium chelatase subunit I
VKPKDDSAIVASAAEFILEGLWAHKRINRSEGRGFFADARKTPEPREPREPSGRPPRRQFN